MDRPAEPARPRTTEAAAWRLLGLLFERPRPGWYAEIAALGEEIETGETLPSLVRSAAGAGEGAYLHFLGPGGAISPRESAYQPMLDPGAILSDLATLYEAFAYRPRTEDPPDHIAVEVGFAGFLTLKQAYAEAQENKEDAMRAAKIRRAFIESHLRDFARGMVGRLEGSGAQEYLIAAARVLAAKCAEVSSERAH